MFRKLLFFVFLFMPIVAFGQGSRLPKYMVAIWEAPFETFVDTVTSNRDKYPILKATPDVEGTLAIEFNTENLSFDLDRGLLNAIILDSYIIRIKNGNMLSIPLPKFSKSTEVTYDLSGHAWNTIMVTEKLDNGQVHNTWYRKILDKDKQLRRWEVAHTVRTK